MACRRPPARTSWRPLLVVLFPLLAGLGTASCGSDEPPLATDPPPTTIAIVPLSSVAGSGTTLPSDPTSTPPASDLAPPTQPIITIAPVTIADSVVPALSPVVPPASAPMPTPARLCPGITALPAGVVTGDRISGNLDGDGIDDVVTAYTGADGSPHVFVQRGSGSGSDIALPLGNSDHVSISFEDVDHDIGVADAPPLVVLAIGAGPAGSAVGAFASLNSDGCVQQWQLTSGPFTFGIDQRGPFRGLLCESVGGRRYSLLRTATPDGAGNVLTSSLQIDHTGISVNLTRLGDETIPDDPSVQKNFGDIQNCDHAPLFP